MTPSVAPNTATRGHSRPLTRWMVDSVTPAGRRGRSRAERSHGSNPAGSGWRSATCSSASRSSRCDCPRRRPRRRAGRPPGPGPPRRGRARAPRGWCRRAATAGQPARSAARSAELVRHLDVVDALGGPHDVVDRAAPAQPLVDPAGQAPAGAPVDLGQVVGVDGVGVGGDAQVGQRGPQAGAGQHVGPQDRRHRDPRLDQRHVRGQQQRADPGEHRHVGGRDPGSASHPRTTSTSSVAPACGQVAAHDEGVGAAVAVGGPAGAGSSFGTAPGCGSAGGGRRVDHGGRAAVVDLERVLVGAGEVAAELGEEPRRRRRGRRSPGRRRPRRTRRTPGPAAAARAARGRGSGPGTRRPAGGGGGPAGPGGTRRRRAAARRPAAPARRSRRRPARQSSAR